MKKQNTGTKLQINLKFEISMIQTLMNPLKVKKSINCHCGEVRARSEVLALFSNFKSFWTPAPALDTDPGFAGVTRIETFCD